MADLQWRRGWTHGVLALGVLPLLLTGALLLTHHATQWRRTWSSRHPVRAGQLLLLSFVAILSHPLLDTLNTYGVRWLMPFSSRWFYGDVLFIVDPWVWLTLGIGLYIAARRRKASRENAERAVWLAMVIVLSYVAAMAASGRAARGIVLGELGGSGPPAQSVMVAPVPVNPFERQFVVVQDEHYQVGTFNWLSNPHIDRTNLRRYPRAKPSHPAIPLAEESEVGRRFLGWARFPTFEVEQIGSREFRVHVVDLRYARNPRDGFGSVSIPVRTEREPRSF
jgi:inner membrane protein